MRGAVQSSCQLSSCDCLGSAEMAGCRSRLEQLGLEIFGSKDPVLMCTLPSRSAEAAELSQLHVACLGQRSAVNTSLALCQTVQVGVSVFV